MSDCRALILDRIHGHGPLTFPQFMELALYHPEAGYYATAARRSGGRGDFYTSVDVGPVFGEFLARQFVEMFALIGGAGADARSAPTVDLVEAAAGNGRLSRDVLEALERTAPGVYERVRLHLVERSGAARETQAETLGRHAARLFSSTPDLPGDIRGILFANELLDALPVHVVVARDEGLREVVIDAAGDRLVEREVPPTTPALEEYFEALGVRLAPGWRAEVNLEAVAWIRRAASALDHGFVVLVDYGDEARALYSAARANGTLATYTAHIVESFDQRREPPWLRTPGASDITAHVDFTSVRNSAAAGGLDAICLVDQMHFLLGLGVEQWLAANAGPGREALARRLALKTLLLPGGLGSSHRVMILGRQMGRLTLRGCR